MVRNVISLFKLEYKGVFALVCELGYFPCTWIPRDFHAVGASRMISQIGDRFQYNLPYDDYAKHHIHDAFHVIMDGLQRNSLTNQYDNSHR